MDANPAACAFYGYPHEEFISRKITDINLLPKDQVFKEMQRAGSEQQRQFFFRHRLSGGEVRDVEVFSGPIRIKSQDLLYSIIHDITARKQAEEAMQRQEEELQIILDSVPAMIFYKDKENRFIRTNKALAEVTGLPKEEMDGKSVFDLYPSQAVDYWKDDQEVMKTGNPKRNIIEPLEAAGEIRWVQTDKIPYKDVHGNIIGVIGFSVDITERKRIEEALMIRTAELEFANQELESFSYSVSHDLKAPVRAIEGFSRMLMGEHADKLDAEALRLLQVITTNTKLMHHLIDDLLALSRLGRLQVRKSVVNLAAMTNKVFEKLRAQAPERDLQLTVGDLPPGLGDQSLLYQVMQNLLANAVKFTKSRQTAVIEVGGRTEGKENIYYVKDNGAGFDERYVSNLFRPFQRLHGGEEYEGTGVGLAIVQRIIQRHGGRVWAEGKVGEGATFYFALPKNED